MLSLYEAFATTNSDERRWRLVQPNPSSVAPGLYDQMAFAASSSSRGSNDFVT